LTYPAYMLVDMHATVCAAKPYNSVQHCKSTTHFGDK